MSLSLYKLYLTVSYFWRAYWCLPADSISTVTWWQNSLSLGGAPQWALPGRRRKWAWGGLPLHAGLPEENLYFVRETQPRFRPDVAIWWPVFEIKGRKYVTLWHVLGTNGLKVLQWVHICGAALIVGTDIISYLNLEGNFFLCLI